MLSTLFLTAAEINGSLTDVQTPSPVSEGQTSTPTSEVDDVFRKARIESDLRAQYYTATSEKDRAIVESFKRHINERGLIEAGRGSIETSNTTAKFLISLPDRESWAHFIIRRGVEEASLYENIQRDSNGILSALRQNAFYSELVAELEKPTKQREQEALEARKRIEEEREKKAEEARQSAEEKREKEAYEREEFMRRIRKGEATIEELSSLVQRNAYIGGSTLHLNPIVLTEKMTTYSFSRSSRGGAPTEVAFNMQCGPSLVVEFVSLPRLLEEKYMGAIPVAQRGQKEDESKKLRYPCSRTAMQSFASFYKRNVVASGPLTVNIPLVSELSGLVVMKAALDKLNKDFDGETINKAWISQHTEWQAPDGFVAQEDCYYLSENPNVEIIRHGDGKIVFVAAPEEGSQPLMIEANAINELWVCFAEAIRSSSASESREGE